MFEDQPVPKLIPRFGVVLALDPLQELGDSIDVPEAVVHLRPLHHLSIQPSLRRPARAGLGAWRPR
ncbi:hypothetical protein AMK31_07665 [Streptomyces sp. TSRI0107]|nr:hypothetical protein AMK31_07665 [Streptomyces sp. TSRI0107]